MFNREDALVECMSVAIDTESGVDKDTYDKEFDETHTVHGQNVSSCTCYPSGGGCITCDSMQ